MLDIFSGLRLVVKRRTINIDNAIFRCHWFFTSTLLVSFSLIITARQYVGQPIECHSVDKIPDSLLNSYCWVQSTFTVPQACAATTSQRAWEVPYPCIDNTRGREIKVYAYYQWVGIVLFVQGLMFHLPYYLWKLWENGLIKAITGGLRVAVLNEHERAKKKEIVVEYINDHLGCHRRYALKYFLCELICLVNLLGQLWATNKFFDGQFLRYGLEVLEYSSSSLLDLSAGDHHHHHHQQTHSSNNNNNHKQQVETLIANNSATGSLVAHYSRATNSPARQSQQQVVDPMTFIFPRMTKCSYFDFGPSGDVQKHDALCLLPLNIINEKIYIALWFWFLVLALLTVLVILYRVAAIASEAVRCKGLISRCKLSSEPDIRLICRHCDVGDWFLFYMVAENLDPLIMREIIAAIASKIADQVELKRELKAQLQREEMMQQLQRQQHQHQHQHQHLDDQQKAEHDTDLRRHLMGAQLSSATLGSGSLLPAGVPLQQPVAPSAPRASLCPSCSSSQPSSRRNSLAEQTGVTPMVRKIKKRLYNRRLLSMDLGPVEARQLSAASVAHGDRSAPSSAGIFEVSNVAEGPSTILGTLTSGLQPPSDLALGGPAANHAITPHRRASQLWGGSSHRRCGSLTRQSSLASSGMGSSVESSGSFVMEMASIRASSPSLLDGGLVESRTTMAEANKPKDQ